MSTNSRSTFRGFTRFSTYFPLAAWIVGHIWLLLPVFSIVALALGTLSIHYGLSVMCVWLGLVCFWVDRKHLDYCLFTPLQPMAVVLMMSLGAGISMVTIDAPEKYSYGFLAMQLVGLLGFPFFMVAYAVVMRRVPGFVFPRLTPGVSKSLARPLVLVGWICLTHELLRVVAGIVSGASDRGYAGDFLVDTPFGWWSAFGIFLRIQTLGYVLVPLIWRESRLFGRVMAGGVVMVILFLHFVAASRGQVFFPIFILLVGSYMFLELKRVKYELILLVGLIGLAPLVTLMANYRSSQAFREADIRDIMAKVGTLKEGLAMQREMQAQTGERFTESGRAFIGVADELVYEMTPDPMPFEGFERLDNVVWTFVPYMFSQGTRPVLQDGYAIVVGYTGLYGARTSIGISWGAEMYRRWGWGGVPIGLFLYGLFYGAVFRYAYRLYLYRNALWGFMVCGLLFHFFIAWFFHSALTTFWDWFYDIPKHLVLLGAIYWSVKLICEVKATPGAFAFAAAERPAPVSRRRPRLVRLFRRTA